jgi:sugar lactone lactonase YvrE
MSPSRSIISCVILSAFACTSATEVATDVATEEQASEIQRPVRVRTILGPTLGIGDALSLDRHDAIYASDFIGTGTSDHPNGDTVSRVMPDGTLRPFVTGIAGPAGTAFDSHGTFYVAAFLGGQVLRRSPEGTLSVFATDLEGPVGVAIDRDDRVYVSVAGLTGPGFRVYRFAPNGEREVFADLGPLSVFGLGGLAFDDEGRLYVSNFVDGRIVRVQSDGEVEMFATVPDLGFPALGYLGFIDDRLYATAIGSNQVLAIDPAGSVQVIAGTGVAAEVDGPGARAAFDGPNGLAVARSQRALWISDTNARTLRRVQGLGHGR